MKIKKLLAVALAAILVLGLLSACTENKNESETQALPTLATPERRPGETGESGETEPVSGTTDPAATGEDPAATGESGKQDPDATEIDSNEDVDDPQGGSNQSGNSGSNQSGSSGSNTGASGDETDEDLYRVEPDTDDSDENLG